LRETLNPHLEPFLYFVHPPISLSIHLYMSISICLYTYVCVHASILITYLHHRTKTKFLYHLTYLSIHLCIFRSILGWSPSVRHFFFVCFVKASVGLKPSPHVCVCVCVYVHTHVCMYVHTHTHTRMYVCMHVCMYVCMYIGLRPRGRDREVY
jgi:hypothetical protein